MERVQFANIEKTDHHQLLSPNLDDATVTEKMLPVMDTVVEEERYVGLSTSATKRYNLTVMLA